MIAIEDQMADKICAMMSDYGIGGAGSSRAKDLVDLAIVALHQPVDAAALYTAIRTESANRSLMPFDVISVSEDIQNGYGKLASTVKPIIGFTAWEDASALVNDMIRPVLTRQQISGTWDPERRRWDD